MEGKWYVTVSCAAGELGCKRSDVYELASRGILDFIRMPGNEIKISSESIEILAASQSVFYKERSSESC
jgi:excisionase family DNA binding protein